MISYLIPLFDWMTMAWVPTPSKLCLQRPAMGGGVPESHGGQEAATTIWRWHLHTAVLNPAPSTHSPRGSRSEFLLYYIDFLNASLAAQGQLYNFCSFPPNLLSNFLSFPQTSDWATKYKRKDKSSFLPHHLHPTSNAWWFGSKEWNSQDREKRSREPACCQKVTAKSQF